MHGATDTDDARYGTGHVRRIQCVVPACARPRNIISSVTAIRTGYTVGIGAFNVRVRNRGKLARENGFSTGITGTNKHDGMTPQGKCELRG